MDVVWATQMKDKPKQGAAPVRRGGTPTEAVTGRGERELRQGGVTRNEEEHQEREDSTIHTWDSQAILYNDATSLWAEPR